MAREIDFYFDFSSPYGYLASTAIEAVAARHGRAVRWRSFLLGALYKRTGYHPLEQPEKRRYMMHDLARSARLMGVPLAVPPSFPESLLAASRAVYWIADQNKAVAGAFATAAFRAYWVEGRMLSDPAVVAAIAAEYGIERERIVAALADPAVKDRLRTETEAAIAAEAAGHCRPGVPVQAVLESVNPESQRTAAQPNLIVAVTDCNLRLSRRC